MAIWKDIDGHPSHQVSDEGEIRNKKRGNILKPNPDRYGYYRLSLGNVDNVPVHRIVAKTFLQPERPEQIQVNHLDGNRQNNHITNLEWCTASENIKHSVERETNAFYKASMAARKVTRCMIRIIQTEEIFESIVDCAIHLGTQPQHIQRVLSGQRAHWHGYTFEYI